MIMNKYDKISHASYFFNFKIFNVTETLKTAVWRKYHFATNHLRLCTFIYTFNGDIEKEREDILKKKDTEALLFAH